VPSLKKYTTKEEGERLESVFKNNKGGLQVIDTEVYCPMFGFKDPLDYYR
jgi:predicted alpha/beta-fold hydrolase